MPEMKRNGWVGGLVVGWQSTCIGGASHYWRYVRRRMGELCAGFCMFVSDKLLGESVVCLRYAGCSFGAWHFSVRYVTHRNKEWKNERDGNEDIREAITLE